jgi:hypothetical protein
VILGFLLNGIYMDCRRLSVNYTVEFSLIVNPVAALAPFALRNKAFPKAEPALDLLIVQLFIIHGLANKLRMFDLPLFFGRRLCFPAALVFVLGARRLVPLFCSIFIPQGNSIPNKQQKH